MCSPCGHGRIRIHAWMPSAGSCVCETVFVCVCVWCIKPSWRANPALEQWLQAERYRTYIISKNLRHEKHAGKGREELHCCLDWLGFDWWLCCMPACLLFMSSLVTFVSKQKQTEAWCCQKVNSNVSGLLFVHVKCQPFTSSR